MIEFKNIVKKYGDFTAVKNLNLKLEQGKITMFIGPSGCGKTTSLKMINRLIEPSSGDIFINGEAVNKLDPVLLRRKIGYAIQEVGLFPHLDVYNNIAVVPHLEKWDEERIKNRVEELLELLTLDSSYMYKYPCQLSGGERQRVGLARALAVNPDIVLMDEPFGSIDPINRGKLHEVFIEIQEEIKKTIAFVTHDINEAIKLGDNIVILKDGEIIQSNSVDAVLAKPANEFVHSLIGHDRSLKALALIKAKNIVKTTYYSIVNKGTSEETVEKQLEADNNKLAFMLNEDEKIEKFFIKGKDRITSYKDAKMIRKGTIKRGEDLNKVLSKMINIGENILPVINRKEKLIGAIHLNDILAEIRKTD
jgi:osmoprotectant transport system ATP-binding protein